LMIAAVQLRRKTLDRLWSISFLMLCELLDAHVGTLPARQPNTIKHEDPKCTM
jgi:hypothetical protein